MGFFSDDDFGMVYSDVLYLILEESGTGVIVLM